MDDQRNPLLCCRLTDILARMQEQPPEVETLWKEAVREYSGTEVKDEDLERALTERDLAGFEKVIKDWDADRRPRPAEDRALLKRAMKAFRKRLKMTKLDDESRLGVGATTKGMKSAIVGITPPNEYAPAVWRELARQGRLNDGGGGTYELNDG